MNESLRHLLEGGGASAYLNAYGQTRQTQKVRRQPTYDDEEPTAQYQRGGGNSGGNGGNVQAQQALEQSWQQWNAYFVEQYQKGVQKDKEREHRQAISLARANQERQAQLIQKYFGSNSESNGNGGQNMSNYDKQCD